EFATKSLALMDDGPRRRRMGEAARARVVAAYSWAANLLPFASLLEGDITGQPGAGAGRGYIHRASSFRAQRSPVPATSGRARFHFAIDADMDRGPAGRVGTCR